MLNEEFPRTNNAERRIGLYIEIKDWKWNKEWTGLNTADMIYEHLVKNGLHTIEGSREDIPVVIQSFDLDALMYFKTLADLPMTLVFGID